MHELSIVMSIIAITEKESAKHNAVQVDEIELEIGDLSGIEMTAFDFAWQQAIKGTVLENAALEIIRPPGNAKCLECGHPFAVSQIYDLCPVCQSHFKEIISGKELRVKSLSLD